MLINVPVIIFTILTVKFYWNENIGWKIVLFILWYLQLSSSFLMLKAASTDPGIVPGRTWNIEGGYLPSKYANVSKRARVQYP